ncbi:MAG: BON domain-containing protein [Acidobacteria bacterium]|nr:BON domain-containing protein [Acidobacteriota bacterium]
MKKGLFLFVAFLVLLVGGYWFLSHLRSKAEEMKAKTVISAKLKEAKLVLSVKAALSLYKEFSPFDIEVDADENGVVVLKGELPSRRLENVAVRIASNVPEVSKVISKIKINPSLKLRKRAEATRSLGEVIDDAAITAYVRSAIALNKELEGAEIKVSTFKRTVFLEGRVKSKYQKKLAVEVAESVNNVKRVVEALVIKE